MGGRTAGSRRLARAGLGTNDKMEHRDERKAFCSVATQSAIKCTNETGKAPLRLGSPSMWPIHHS